MMIDSTMSLAGIYMPELIYFWKPNTSSQFPAFFSIQIFFWHFHILDGELDALTIAVTILALLADVRALQGNFVNVLST